MIFIGYQGIGKTTLAATKSKYIDLESSQFFIDGKRDPNWYKVYCRIATGLSRQGHHVFTSSHQVVRDELFKICPYHTAIIYPSLSLKDAWLKKLKERWRNDNSDKNYKAYMNAVDRYNDNIMELASSVLPKIEINNADYKLEELIEKFLYKGRAYTITVFVDYDEKGIHNSRCVGYYTNFADADEDVKNNNLDIHEYTYTYAVIEKMEEGLYPLAKERWFYEWDGGYKPMEEPKELIFYTNFCIG